MSKYIFLLFFIPVLTLLSCSKKNHPSNVVSSKNADTLVVKKVIPVRKIKVAVPKVISVSDSGAHKTVDGRYYYDLAGHRYWRNNKDGKYYLFNKAMYSNDDFKPTGK